MMSDDDMPLQAVTVVAQDVIAQTTQEGDVPAWAVACVEEWRGILHLDAWAIRLKLDANPNGEQDTTAFVSIYPNIMTAHITIKDTIPQSLDGLPEGEARFWESVIIHELVHVFIGRITDFVEKDIWPELAPSAQRIASATFTREVEPVVELLASVLYGLKKGKGEHG